MTRTKTIPEVLIPWRQWQIFTLLFVVTRSQQVDAVRNVGLCAPFHFLNGEYAGVDRLDACMYIK